MLGYRVVAELGHLAEHRPAAPFLRRFAARHPGQRLQPGPHGVRVGVVGVVDDRDAVGAGGDLHAVLATPGPPPPARPPPVRGWRRIPARRRRRTARWTPGGRRARPSATSTWPSPACSVNRGRASSSSVTAPAHTSAAEPVRPTRTTRAARLVGHRGHRRVVDVEDHHPGRRNSLRQFGFRRRDGLAGNRTHRGARCRR